MSNHQNINDLLTGFVLGELPEQQTEQVKAHLEACSICREDFRRLRAVLDCTAALSEKTADQTACDAARKTLFAAVEHEKTKDQRPGSQRGPVSIWRSVMKNRITKFAAAAVIVIGVLGVLVRPTKDSVAWADVWENMRQAHNYIHRMKMVISGPALSGKTKNVEFVMYRSTEFGIRRDTYSPEGTLLAQLYLQPQGNEVIEVLHPQKKYVKAGFTEEQLRELTENNDPCRMALKFAKYKYAELGRKFIDGVEVEGIEINDPASDFGATLFEKGIGRVWADVETDLPVLIEIEGTASGGSLEIKLYMDQFDWEANLTAADFEPVIPEGYSLGAEVDVSATEEAMLKALRTFAQCTDGKYPSHLDVMTSSKEITVAIITQKRRNGEPAGDQPTQEELEKVLSIQAACLFYGKLSEEDKEPAYYGKTVTAEYPHAVLMRWKLDDGNYRVVFGDLQVEMVTAEQLSELEAAPLNQQSQPIKPEPFDGALSVPTEGVQLNWLPGLDARSHQIYFGTDRDALPLLAVVDEPQYTQLPSLDSGVAYYWRVDEIQSDGTTIIGPVWQFSPVGLIARYTLDEESGLAVTDFSGDELNGSIVGDVKWVDGISGNALQFDGEGDFVNLGLQPVFNLTDQITISVWIKVSAFDTPWQPIVAKGDTAWRISRGLGDNVHFACTGLWPEWVHGQVNVNDGQWHHVAGVYDGATLSLYVDGELDVSVNTSGAINVNNYPVYIGGNAEEPDRTWNGSIDDVSIFSYALTDGEIINLYNLNVPSDQQKNKWKWKNLIK